MCYKSIIILIYIWVIIIMLSGYGVSLEAMEDETELDAKIDQLAEDIAVQIPKDFLFQLDPKFQIEFEDKKISMDLRKCFQDNGIQLSDKARISHLENKLEKWLITDEGKEYAVEKEENGNLSVCSLKYIGIIDFALVRGDTKIIEEPGAYFASRFGHGLLKTRRYIKIVESEKLKEVLKELGRQSSDFYDPQKVQRIGKLPGVDLLIVGQLWSLKSIVQTEANLINMEDATTIAKGMKPIPCELFPEKWAELISCRKPSPPPPPGQETYILPTLRELNNEEVIYIDKLDYTANYLIKNIGISDLALVESWIKEIDPDKLPSVRWDHPIKFLDALKLAEYAAKSWATESRLVYSIAGVSQVAYSQTRDSYYIPIYRWIFFYKSNDSSFLRICVDPGPEVTDLVSWTLEGNRVTVNDDEKTYKDFAPINTSELKLDSYDAIQTVIKHGAMPADSAIFLRMEDFYGQHIPVWFIAFHGTFGINAVTGEIVLEPIPKSPLCHEFQNDSGEKYQAYSYKVKTEFDVPEIPRPPYNEYFLQIDFRTRVQLALETSEWKTYFYYKEPVEWVHGVPNGASTRKDLTSPIIAKAKLISYDDKGTVISEVHYNEDGAVTYEGTVTFSSQTGFKKEEKPIRGTKRAEYYFLWPSGTM